MVIILIVMEKLDVFSKLSQIEKKTNQPNHKKFSRKRYYSMSSLVRNFWNHLWFWRKFKRNR
jgi:hypothetical protein